MCCIPEEIFRRKDEKMKRILWVNPSFLDYRIPLYQELDRKLNHNFYLVYSKYRIPERCEKKIHAALNDHAVSIRSEKIISLGGKSDFANSGVKIPIPCGLYSAIASTQPDLVIAEGFFQFTPMALLYCLIHRLPLWIAYERTAHIERNCPWYRMLYRKLVSHFVSGYLANGSLTKEYLQSWGIPVEKIHTGAMCADSKNLSSSVAALNQEAKDRIRKTLGLHSGLTFLFCGRMIKLKGCKYLLAEWRRHIKDFPEDNLLLVGDGPVLPIFRKQYQNEQSIHFAGGVDYDQIYQYYAVSDVFIIPTLEDNWSLVVPEAMACGLPVATSIYNGCYPEFATQGNGMTFDPLKDGDIQHVLAEFHKADLKAMGERSRMIERDYSPDQTAERIVKAVLS